MAFEPNFEKLEELLQKYAGLDLLLLGGVISKKICRAVLDIDRWEMDDLHTELITSMCIKNFNANSFRAIPVVVEFINERENSNA